MRLLAVAVTILAISAAASPGPAETHGGIGAGTGLGAATPAGPGRDGNHVRSDGPDEARRYHQFAQCRRRRGYPPTTRTPSKRELTACRKQLARDAQKDTHTAIRVVFDEPDWPAAICIVDHEGRRWNRVAPIGAAGEITSWQWHPGWWKPGHTFNGGPPVLDEQRLRESALYATRAARRLWERSGRSFRVHWVNSSRKCGL